MDLSLQRKKSDTFELPEKAKTIINGILKNSENSDSLNFTEFIS